MGALQARYSDEPYRGAVSRVSSTVHLLGLGAAAHRSWLAFVAPQLNFSVCGLSTLEQNDSASNVIVLLATGISGPFHLARTQRTGARATLWDDRETKRSKYVPLDLEEKKGKPRLNSMKRILRREEARCEFVTLHL
ncbi:hypothetical protein PEBR_22244 [Penicillium brasilianum]|uniref:Uncharacterized protein n=1 Tax=Penicillium brasilianum TaxID=104259 RepID=A0A1S9RMJ7_PENBI|nr:hypothetical protein PEBR_22244 [Penicillium brasilianum]